MQRTLQRRVKVFGADGSGRVIRTLSRDEAFALVERGVLRDERDGDGKLVGVRPAGVARRACEQSDKS